MEEILNGEQPSIIDGNVQSGIVESKDKGTTCPNENHGSLGKFKDTESLLNAYNNLQAEFTRKCQKLSELMKSSENLEDENANLTITDNLSQKDKNETKEKLNENSKNEPLENENIHLNSNEDVSNNDEIISENKEELKPIFEKQDWHDKVASFLIENSEAKEYSGEIANVIMNDKELQSSPYALEIAWARIMKKEYAKPTSLAHDQNFIREKILTQDQVKMQVLQEYFKNIQNKKIPPVITSSGVVAGVTHKEPTNLTEAKQMVEKLFNLKG